MLGQETAAGDEDSPLMFFLVESFGDSALGSRELAGAGFHIMDSTVDSRSEGVQAGWRKKIAGHAEFRVERGQVLGHVRKAAVLRRLQCGGRLRGSRQGRSFEVQSMRAASRSNNRLGIGEESRGGASTFHGNSAAEFNKAEV